MTFVETHYVGEIHGLTRNDCGVFYLSPFLEGVAHVVRSLRNMAVGLQRPFHSSIDWTAVGRGFGAVPSKAWDLGGGPLRLEAGKGD